MPANAISRALVIGLFLLLSVISPAVTGSRVSEAASGTAAPPDRVSPIALPDIVFFNCDGDLAGGSARPRELADAYFIRVGPASPSACYAFCYEADPETLELVCPGPPASLAILAAPSSTCGSIETLTVTVTDSRGRPAADGTPINFSTNLGYVSSAATTRGGTVVTSLTLYVSGIAQVNVDAGTVAGQKAISVTCP